MLGLTTVFGGSGFLGRRIVKHLLDHSVAVRAASRHSTLAKHPQVYGGSLSAVKADILDQEQVAAAVSGASTVINAVSLYTEHGDVTFERVHVEAASRLAAAAREAGAVRYIQISGIGSNPRAASAYIRARGQGEEAVGAAFPNSIIVRPAVPYARRSSSFASPRTFLRSAGRFLPARLT
ncbi:NAD(P)H-binding protein [Nitrobacter winogradskyi]|uniref:NAD(P)H-binding protein n=1 Tax=Nitrobacter winogradskyi TaxID=913 RepID=UPI00209ED5DC|nr:NAD(P)H-binding protein [Nitrobacter winogradskyi]